MIKFDSDIYKVAGILPVLALLLFSAYYVTRLSFLFWIFCVFCIIFFFAFIFLSDPERKGPIDNQSVVSAADGVVIDVSTVETEGFHDKRALRIAVFMNVFNVHVNRSPVSGTVLKTVHKPGKKISAYKKRAENENECGDTDIETSLGLVRVRQIAGLVARRVVTRVHSGDVLGRGDRIGIIRFGSRVDVFLPLTYAAVVDEGDHVRAGESVIALPANTMRK